MEGSFYGFAEFLDADVVLSKVQSSRIVVLSIKIRGPNSGMSACCPDFQTLPGPGWYLRGEGVVCTSGEAMARGKPLRQTFFV